MSHSASINAYMKESSYPCTHHTLTYMHNDSFIARQLSRILFILAFNPNKTHHVHLATGHCITN